MPIPPLSVDEIVATIRHSSLPTLLVEGRDDMTVYSWIQSKRQRVKPDILPCGGRRTLLDVYARRTEFAEKQVLFLADQDMWMFSGIPAGYDKIIWTRGYSIENDLLNAKSVHRLLGRDECREFAVICKELSRWFAFEVNEYLNGRPHFVNVHVNRILPLGATELCKTILRERGFAEPPSQLVKSIRREATLRLRGKTVLQVYTRILNAPDRISKFSCRNVVEIAAKGARNRHVKRLRSAIEQTINAQASYHTIAQRQDNVQ